MKVLGTTLILALTLIFSVLNPAEAGGRNHGHGHGHGYGRAIVGGFILGTIFSSPYRYYPYYPYYPPVYQPQPVWVVDRYEWAMVCPGWGPCYQTQIPVGHWEYR